MIKALVRSVAPEFAIRLYRRARGRPAVPELDPPTPHLEWEHIKTGWPQALPAIQGWDVPSVAETQRAKWAEFVESISGPGPLGISHESPAGSGRENRWAHNLIMSYGYVLALAARTKTRLSVLDWGGGVGHYHEISRALVPDLDLDYYCQDVPKLAETGRDLVPTGHFFDDTTTCFDREYDFVMAGSSVWCVEDWEYIVERLAGSTKEYLYITRMMFVDQVPSFVAVQRPLAYGYQTEYPLWILNRPEFLAHLENLGLTLVREFLFGPGPHIHDAPEQGYFKGFLFRRVTPK